MRAVMPYKSITKMTLEDLGLNQNLKAHFKTENPEAFEVGRVIVEHKERYIVQTKQGNFNAEITGNLRFTAESRVDFPTVGDWIKLSIYDKDLAVIQGILPRTSLLERQAIGKYGERQLIAANVDYAFIIQSVGHDFNLNRLERYVTICHSSSIVPIIVLSKIDLITPDEIQNLTRQVQKRAKDVPVVALSNESMEGYEALKTFIKKGKTYCMLGSSGVGKSSLTNNLLGEQLMGISTISESTNKGKHITSYRALFVLQTGGIIIDTPGMRELGITDQAQSVEQTFDYILQLAESCKFNDCTHTNEVGCAVLEALEDGELDYDAYENYQKLRRERMHFESTIREKRAKDKKQGKLYKRIQQIKRKNKY